MKVTGKSKTIFWLSVIKGTFRTTFYFTDKAEETIIKSNISDKLKGSFKDTQGNKFRGLTLIFVNKMDVEEAKELIKIKLSVK
jgi:hypothetical protein